MMLDLQRTDDEALILAASKFMRHTVEILEQDRLAPGYGLRFMKIGDGEDERMAYPSSFPNYIIETAT